MLRAMVAAGGGRERAFMTAGSTRRPWALGTGLPAQNFAQGQIKYVDLDLTRMEGKFAPDIAIPRAPFRGILDVGAAR